MGPLRRLGVTLLAVRVATVPVAAHGTGHGGGGHTPWAEWVAVAVLAVGLCALAAGLYVDHASERRTARADALVVGGVSLALAGMAVFWL